MKDSPLIVRPVESLNTEILGSVHLLYRNVPRILKEIGRFSPNYIGIELTNPGPTGSQDVDGVSTMYSDRLVFIDRPPGITVSRYLCDTPPRMFLKECLIKYAWLPLNQASIILYNYFPGLNNILAGDNFFSFGWSAMDTRYYIFERDQYMAGRFLEFLRDREDRGLKDRCIILTGRRHVAGIACILEAYAITGDIGSYYAGGRVLDVFSLNRLEKPYATDRNTAEKNLVYNGLIESMVSTIFLPLYMLALFGILFGITFLVTFAFLEIAGL